MDNSMQPVEATTPVHRLDLDDTVSDCFTRAQIQEDAEESVVEIIDGLLSEVMRGCLKVHVRRQLPAHCVSWAKSYIIQTLEQQILCQDEGDGPEDVSETEDSEPSPVIPDSWARGLVPVLTAAPPSPPNVQQVPADPGVDRQRNAAAQTSSSSKRSEKEASPRRRPADEHCKVPSPHHTPRILRRKRHLGNLTPKPVPGKLLPPLSCSAEEKDVMLESKNRAHSYPPKDYRPMKTIDLPRHCVPIQFEIVDNSCTKPQRSSGLVKLVPKSNKHQTVRAAATLEPLARSRDQAAAFPRRNETDVFLKKPSPSSRALRLDTMVLTKGVTLRGPQEAEMAPLKLPPPEQSMKLRPVRSDVTGPWISADQFTAGPPPNRTISIHQ